MAGFLSRLFGFEKQAEPAEASLVSRRVVIGQGWGEDLEVSGEAHYRAEIGRIFLGLGRDEGGVTMQVAHLIPEPTNKYDPNAVRVLVLGEQVGHVPQEASEAIGQACRGVGRGKGATAPVRIWARNDDGIWRSRVTLMFSGDSESEKDYASDRREYDAYTAKKEADENLKLVKREARETLKEARRTAGQVDGQYWPLLKPSISELKRQKRFEEARDLLKQCIDAAEREATVTGTVPDSWPSEQISVVLRRLRDYDAELAFLERYVAVCADNEIPDSVTVRLNRSRLAADRLPK